YEQVTGDFDRAVRVARQEATSRYARAGLMARETLDGGKQRPTNPFDPAQAFSRYIQVHVNPTETAEGGFGNNSHQISFRPYPGGIGGGDPDATFLLPVQNNAAPEYPNAWLRIKREGQLFRMFRGNNGNDWIEIGSATFPTATVDGEPVAEFPQTIYIGTVYSPENGNISFPSGLRRPFMAEFRDYKSASGTVAPILVIRKVAAGQVEISWGGKGTLQSTDSLGNGAWQDVGLSANPYLTTPAGVRYFRVKR
ncbi:MAG: hypothetical protein ACO1QB_18010, partial [Verrucomicrobiales bacterium]